MDINKSAFDNMQYNYDRQTDDYLFTDSEENKPPLLEENKPTLSLFDAPALFLTAYLSGFFYDSSNFNIAIDDLAEICLKNNNPTSWHLYLVSYLYAHLSPNTELSNFISGFKALDYIVKKLPGEVYSVDLLVVGCILNIQTLNQEQTESLKVVADIVCNH